MTKAKKNSAEYWAERIASRTWDIYNSAEEKNRVLLAMYKDASQQITNELYRLAEKLQKQGFKNTDVHRNNQLVKLNVEILKTIKQLGGDVEAFEQESMFSAFAENYEMIGDVIGGVDFAMPNKRAMEKMMKQPWRGSDFSSRLWKNTKQLSAVLNDVLRHGIQQGKTVTEIAVDIDNQMQAGFNAAHRLARTETMHILNESSKEGYKEAGVKKIQFWAAEDERTCDQCGKLHGNEYEIGKEPTLPLHPNCRCTYLPVIENEPKNHIDISVQRDIIKEKKVLESKAYFSAIKAEELKIYKDNVETAVIFDNRGNILFRESSGASNYVKFSKEQLSRMKGATLTHNHPSNSTFSPADVSILTEQGLDVIRATGVSKTYQLKKLKGTDINHAFSVDYEKAMKDNKKITDIDFRKYEKQYKRGDLSPIEYQEKISGLNKKWNDLNSEWLKKNSRNYGYRYSVIERRK